MQHSSISRWKLVMMAGLVLAVAALACGTPAAVQPTVAPTTAGGTKEPPATAVPEVTDAPTEEEDDKGTPADNDNVDPDDPSANAITLDNAANITELWAQVASESSLFAAAASPIDHQVATFGLDKIVRLWDGDTGDLLSELRPAHANHGWGLSYSPDGSQLASGGGFEARIWDANTGQMFSSATVNAFVFKTVWTPDGTALAVVGQDSSRIDVVDPVTGSNEFQISSPDGIILWSVAFTDVGTSLMATGNANGGVRVTNIDADPVEEVIYDKDASRGAIVDLEFSPDGSKMAACTGTGGVYLWETSNWTIALSGTAHTSQGCNDGVFSPDSEVYFSVGTDGYLYAWDAAEGTRLTSLQAQTGIWSIDVTGDGELLVMALADGVISVVGLP